MNAGDLQGLSAWCRYKTTPSSMPVGAVVVVFRASSPVGRLKGESDIVCAAVTSNLREFLAELETRNTATATVIRAVESETDLALDFAWKAFPATDLARVALRVLLRRYWFDHLELPPAYPNNPLSSVLQVVEVANALPQEEQQEVFGFVPSP